MVEKLERWDVVEVSSNVWVYELGGGGASDDVSSEAFGELRTGFSHGRGVQRKTME
jgi:hypothetical protein